MKNSPMKDRLIVALDFSSQIEVKDFFSKVDKDISWVKVGMELYYSEGPDIISYIKDKGYKVFLDLKLHDIPNTVEKASRSLYRLGVDMLNFHAAGGSTMLMAAKKHAPQNTLLIAVTQLTSTSELQMQKEQLITVDLKSSVLNYAQLSLESGMNGVVCSALEAAAIKSQWPQCITVCPGIRMREANSHDQIRTATPGTAIQQGADYIVMGRNITEAKEPKKMLTEIYQDMEST